MAGGAVQNSRERCGQSRNTLGIQLRSMLLKVGGMWDGLEGETCAQNRGVFRERKVDGRSDVFILIGQTGTCAVGWRETCVQQQGHAHCAVNWSAMWAKVKRSYVAYWSPFKCEVCTVQLPILKINCKLNSTFLKPSEKIFSCTMSNVLHTRRAVLKRIPLKWGKASYFSTAQHEDWRSQFVQFSTLGTISRIDSPTSVKTASFSSFFESRRIDLRLGPILPSLLSALVRKEYIGVYY